MTVDYYRILVLEENCSFSELKKAYYRAAKNCHPDRFGNSESKKREFQLLVEAFDVLSDPVKRRIYDASRHSVLEQMAASGSTASSAATGSIMDDEAGDILEELIVGNDVPPEASLMTLLSDLEKTDIFVAYREGKDHLFSRRYRAARRALEYAVRRAPTNIVFRVCLARACVGDRAYRDARNHLNTAIELGRRRDPPQKLLKVRDELGQLKRRMLPWYVRLFAPADDSGAWRIQTAEEEMREELSRAMTKAARRSLRDVRLDSGHAEKKHLDE